MIFHTSYVEISQKGYFDFMFAIAASVILIICTLTPGS